MCPIVVPTRSPPGPRQAPAMLLLAEGDDEPCYSSTCISAVNSLATE
jgi:hypothetical protein